jgi:hypothetical protein
LQKAAVGAFAAITIATSTLSAPAAVDAFVPSSSTMVAEKVIREGVYRDYEVDVQPQQFDDARSTFKPAKETKTNKGEGGGSAPALSSLLVDLFAKQSSPMLFTQENTLRFSLFSLSVRFVQLFIIGVTVMLIRIFVNTLQVRSSSQWRNTFGT